MDITPFFYGGGYYIKKIKIKKGGYIIQKKYFIQLLFIKRDT